MATTRALDEAVKPSQHVSASQIAAVAASADSTPFKLAEAKRPKSSPQYASPPTLHHPPPQLTMQQHSISADRRKAAALKALYAPTDPISQLPSSPPQIYLNLLILEASLRSQYLTLRSRRRQHIFFLLILGLYVCALVHAVFLRPREDGQGYGGSPYWAVDTLQKIGLLAGVITGGLVWGTGVWERGVRWPRRWVGVTNRGLRVCNLKVVVVRGKWHRRLIEAVATLVPIKALFGGEERSGSLFAVIENVPEVQKRKSVSGEKEAVEAAAGYAYRDGYRRPGAREEDIAHGGDTIKLLLLPKHFSPEFRENWELYRAEYWERENERRAELRKIVRARQKAALKEQRAARGWFGFLGLGRRAETNTTGRVGSDLEKSGHLHPHGHHMARPSKESLSRRRRGSNLSAPSHSRSSSRSSMRTTPETDDGRFSEKPAKTRKARPSSASSGTLAMTTKSPSHLHEVEIKKEEESETGGKNELERKADARREALQRDNAVKKEEEEPERLGPASRFVKRASSLSSVSSSDDGADDGASIVSERSTTSS